jgi:Na+-translocating ferredoxin:NAD+ oxidoreductase RnfG subunit
MNRILVFSAMVGLLGAAVPTFADDVVTAAGKAQQNKVMEECMTKQAESNTQMSKADLRKKCQEQMQAQKDSADKMSGAPPK